MSFHAVLDGELLVIRDGVVIYPPPDRTVGLHSLTRFKEDDGEVVLQHAAWTM